MPTGKITFDDVYNNIDEVGLGGASAKIIDAFIEKYKDGAGGKRVIRRRPGLLAYKDFSAFGGPNRGGFYVEKKGYSIISCLGNIYKLFSDGTTVDLTTIEDGSNHRNYLHGQERVIFSMNGSYLVMANGGEMLSFNIDTDSLNYISDTDAPDNVSHVCHLNQYTLANDIGTGRVHYSSIANPEAWAALDFDTAESNPDNCVGLFDANNRIYVFGTKTLEQWVNDPSRTGPFARLDYATISTGCSAPYSIQKLGPTFIWFDDRKKLITLEGGGVRTHSGPYDKLFQSFTTVDDAYGDVVEMLGQVFYILTFPTEDRSFLYNVTSDSWNEIGYWNTSKAAYERFRCGYYFRAWGKHLMCDHSDGNIYEFSPDVYEDNGNIIRTLIRTGNIDHGTYQRKDNVYIDFMIQRGVGDSDDSTKDPYMGYRWRMDGDEWGDQVWLDLGKIGLSTHFAREVCLGHYKCRQDEYDLSDKVPLTFVGAEERFKWLEEDQ